MLLNKLSIYAAALILIAVVGIILFMTNNKSSSSAPLSEEQAVALVKSKNPELAEYPSDQLPPRSIVAERAGDGWHVMFVQNGSGVDVVSAQCFKVADDQQVSESGTYTYDGTGAAALVTVKDLSPATCQISAQADGVK